MQPLLNFLFLHSKCIDHFCFPVDHHFRSFFCSWFPLDSPYILLTCMAFILLLFLKFFSASIMAAKRKSRTMKIWDLYLFQAVSKIAIDRDSLYGSLGERTLESPVSRDSFISLHMYTFKFQFSQERKESDSCKYNWVQGLHILLIGNIL